MSSRQIFQSTLIILGTLLAAYVLLMSLRIIIVLLIAIIIASAIRPMVAWLTRRRISPGIAIILIYLMIALIMLGVGLIVLPPIVNQLVVYFGNDGRLAYQIIRAQTFIETTAESLTGRDITLLPAEEIRTGVSTVMDEIRSSMPSLVNNLSNTAGDAVLIFVMGAYWLTSHARATQFIMQLFPPRHQEQVVSVVNEIETTMGGYVRGSAVVVAFVFVAELIVLSLLRVPNTMTLAVIIGITTAIPMIGSLIGAIVATFLTLLISPVHAFGVLATYLVIQQIENYVVSPRVMSHSVGLDPLLVIVYTAVGFIMFGVTGALIAVPIMGVIHILLEQIIVAPHKEHMQPYRVENGLIILNPDPSTPNTTAVETTAPAKILISTQE